MTAGLDAAREAYERHEWQTAYDELQAGEPLEAEDLELLAEAARWSGREHEIIGLLERAAVAYAERRDRRAEARVTLHMAQEHYWRNEQASAAGCWSRAARLLEGLPECEEHGLAAWMAGHAYWDTTEVDVALSFARETAAIGRRLGSRDLEALGLHDEGHVLLATGDVEAGRALIDEAATMSAATGLMAAGNVYCGAIWAYRNMGDWQRAGEWTDASLRWCERQAVTGFPGLCRFHRAEVRRLRGELDIAERDALDAAEELLRAHPRSAAWAFMELGEIRRRRGDLRGASLALQRSRELGWDPQPVSALLHLDQGDVGSAARSVTAALGDDSLFARECRAQLLPAAVTVSLANGDRETAERSAAELEALSERFATAATVASAAGARGELCLATGDAEAAAAHFRRSCRGWSEVPAPFETARAGVLLADALRRLGDERAAVVELGAALATFERLGAIAQAAKTRVLLHGEGEERATRTFLFTDIVNSTKLVDAMGDGAWGNLLRWHDRTLRSQFAAHRGEEVKHEGDGFFVAFANAGDAIACAVAIQRDLAAQREEHGFAPAVRIGAHAGEANVRDGDFTGRVVHLAARVAAAGHAGEILVSAGTATSTESDGTRRLVPMKGFPEPVEVVTIEWER